MRILSRARFGVVVAGALLLGSCSASQPGIVPTAPAALAGQGISWMNRGVKDRDLLYVTNAGGATVSVFRYWQRTLVGKLTGFDKPMGDCADAAGHVYITDAKGKIVEYAHGGTSPIKTLHDAPYAPWACSVSPTNGDLAVANSSDERNKGGSIAIYPGGDGAPVILRGTRKGDLFTGCAYDDRGDLLAMAQYLSGGLSYYDFYYLPRKAEQLERIRLPELGQGNSQSGTIGAIVWDGKYWVVGAVANHLYLYSIAVKARLVQQLSLIAGNVGAIAVYRRSFPDGRATQFVGGVNSTQGRSAVYYWRYPGGGEAIHAIRQDIDDPFDVAVSLRS